MNNYHIEIIDRNNPGVVSCCKEMLRVWLEIDPLASWIKLVDAIKRIGSTTNLLSTVSVDFTGSTFVLLPCCIIVCVCACACVRVPTHVK